MAYATDDTERCESTLERAGDDHIHQCVFAREHTDWEYDGSHQCECEATW